MNDSKKPLIVIVGPTAVGKTEISLRLAERFQGEIVSADSRLFYTGMDIGTAKPSREERQSVPHHLIDVAAPDQVWSLAVYLPRALRAIHEINARGSLPFLVGGTGQYIQAVVEGWDIPDTGPDPALREALNQWAAEIGVEQIRQRLEVLDPEAAAGIDGPNLRRMVRALEVIFSSGKKFSAQKTRSGSPFDILQIGLIRPREQLYERIDQRVENMLQAGLVAEVQGLLDRGYTPDLSALSAIGYKQIAAFLQNEISLEEAVRRIKSKTRKYVRQQANWFKLEDPRIRWYPAGENPVENIFQEIQQFLS